MWMKAIRLAETSLLFAERVGQGFQLIIVRGNKVMPPKKKSEGADGTGPLLGRFGTSLKCGIVGLPNVG